MLHRNVRADLCRSSEGSPISRNVVGLALQDALIGQSRSRVDIDADEFRSYRCCDRNRRHSVVPKNIDSKWKGNSCFDVERKPAQKRDGVSRYTRSEKWYISEVLYD